MIPKLIHTADGKLEVDDPFVIVGTKVQTRTNDENRRAHVTCGYPGKITEKAAKRNAKRTSEEAKVYVSWSKGDTGFADAIDVSKIEVVEEWTN